MLKHSRHRYSFYFENGQAVTEMLIGITLLVPFLLAIGVVAQYLDIQFKTHEASRYAAWERTIWSENKKVAEKAGNIVKSSEEMSREIDGLFFHSPRVAIHNKLGSAEEGRQGNMLWRDQTGTPLLKSNNANTASVSRSYQETTGKTPSTNIMDVMEPFELLGVKVGLTAIRRKNFSQITIESPLTPVAFSNFGRLNRTEPMASQDSGSSIYSKSAILSQTWMATDEAAMADTIAGLVVDGNLLKFGGELVGAVVYEIVRWIPINNFPFKEIESAFKNKTRLIPEDQSLILPNYAIKGRTEPRKTITHDIGAIMQWQ